MSHLNVGHEPSHLVEATRKVLLDVTGDEYEGCPWRVFEDPYVYDVLQAFGWMESGQVALHFGGLDGPNLIVEGVLHYQTVLSRIRIDALEREQKKKKAAAGQVQTVAMEDLQIVGMDGSGGGG